MYLDETLIEILYSYFFGLLLCFVLLNKCSNDFSGEILSPEKSLEQHHIERFHQFPTIITFIAYVTSIFSLYTRISPKKPMKSTHV